MKDVLLEAENGQNQKDGPSGNVEKAVKFHPQSPLLISATLFEFQQRGEVATLRMSRSKLKGSRGQPHLTIPSTGFCK
jgi:hypothetical protein